MLFEYAGTNLATNNAAYNLVMNKAVLEQIHMSELSY